MRSTNSSYYLKDKLAFLDPYLSNRIKSSKNTKDPRLPTSTIFTEDTAYVNEDLTIDDVKKIIENDKKKTVQNNSMTGNNNKNEKVMPTVSSTYKKKKNEMDSLEKAGIKLAEAAQKQLELLAESSNKNIVSQDNSPTQSHDLLIPVSEALGNIPPSQRLECVNGLLDIIEDFIE